MGDVVRGINHHDFDKICVVAWIQEGHRRLRLISRLLVALPNRSLISHCVLFRLGWGIAPLVIISDYIQIGVLDPGLSRLLINLHSDKDLEFLRVKGQAQLDRLLAELRRDIHGREGSH